MRYTIRQIPGTGMWAVWDTSQNDSVKSQPVYTRLENAESAVKELNRLEGEK